SATPSWRHRTTTAMSRTAAPRISAFCKSVVLSEPGLLVEEALEVALALEVRLLEVLCRREVHQVVVVVQEQLDAGGALAVAALADLDAVQLGHVAAVRDDLLVPPVDLHLGDGDRVAGGERRHV